MRFLFVFLLIAVALASFSLGQPVKKPSDVLQPPPMAIFSAPKPSDLREFSPADKGFKAIFAGIPNLEVSESESQTVSEYTSFHNGARSTVIVVEYENPVEDPSRTLEFYRGLLTAKGEKILAERDAAIDGYPVKEFDIESTAKRLKARLLILGNRVYDASSEAVNWSAVKKIPGKTIEFEAESTRFLDSLKILMKPEPLVSPNVDELFGRRTEAGYRNDFFKFSVRIPVDWSDLELENADALTRGGIQIYKTNKEEFNRALEESTKDEIIIFAAQLLGKSQMPRSNFVLSVRKQLKPAFSSATIARATKELFLQNPKISLLEDVQTEVKDGIRRSSFTMVTRLPEITFYQRMIVMVRRGFAIVAVISSLNADQFKSDQKLFEDLSPFQ